jgi:hypothetical protein
LIADSSSIDGGSGSWTENRENVYSYDGNGNMVSTELFADSFGSLAATNQRNILLTDPRFYIVKRQYSSVQRGLTDS